MFLTIRVLRKRRGLTQGELAQLLDVSRMTVFRWETGTTQPRAHHLAQLARVLNVPADLMIDILPASERVA